MRNNFIPVDYNLYKELFPRIDKTSVMVVMCLEANILRFKKESDTFTRKFIIKDTGCSDSSIKKSVNELRKMGIIKTESKGNDGLTYYPQWIKPNFKLEGGSKIDSQGGSKIDSQGGQKLPDLPIQNTDEQAINTIAKNSLKNKEKENTKRKSFSYDLSELLERNNITGIQTLDFFQRLPKQHFEKWLHVLNNPDCYQEYTERKLKHYINNGISGNKHDRCKPPEKVLEALRNMHLAKWQLTYTKLKIAGTTEQNRVKFVTRIFESIDNISFVQNTVLKKLPKNIALEDILQEVEYVKNLESNCFAAINSLLTEDNINRLRDIFVNFNKGVAGKCA